MQEFIKEYLPYAGLILIGTVLGFVIGIDITYPHQVKHDKEVIESYMNQCLTYMKENSTNKKDESPRTIYFECREHTEKLLNYTKPSKDDPSRVEIGTCFKVESKDNEEKADK